MRKTTLLLLTFLLAAPVSAAWDVTANDITFSFTGDLSIVQEVHDAVVWERNNRALTGAFIVMSQPSISVTDNGNGTGTIALTLPRPQADNWMMAYGVDNGRCQDDPTNQQLLQCVDDAIKSGLKNTTKDYRQSRVTQVQEPSIQ